MLYWFVIFFAWLPAWMITVKIMRPDAFNGDDKALDFLGFVAVFVASALLGVWLGYVSDRVNDTGTYWRSLYALCAASIAGGVVLGIIIASHHP